MRFRWTKLMLTGLLGLVVGCGGREAQTETPSTSASSSSASSSSASSSSASSSSASARPTLSASEIAEGKRLLQIANASDMLTCGYRPIPSPPVVAVSEAAHAYNRVCGPCHGYNPTDKLKIFVLEVLPHEPLEGLTRDLSKAPPTVAEREGILSFLKSLPIRKRKKPTKPLLTNAEQESLLRYVDSLP